MTAARTHRCGSGGIAPMRDLEADAEMARRRAIAGDPHKEPYV
ncbi:hypothetical protein AB0L67_28485 [Streptomyces flaveolus]